MLSPRSRGKGSRRVPWRDGGRRKQKRSEWQKRAAHAVKELSELSGVLVVLPYRCPSGRTPAEAIYRIDQQIARTGIRYYAELHGTPHWPLFMIQVPAQDAARVRSLIEQVEKQ
jgi:hypothetical protein